METRPTPSETLDDLTSVLKPSSSKPKGSRGAGSFLLSWLALAAGWACVIGSGYMFYLFAENDFGVKVLLSAFALCFGVGALGFIPLFIIARLIKNSRKLLRKNQAYWGLALSVPWLITGAVMLSYPNNMRYAGLFAVILSILFIIWAFRHLRYIRHKTAAISA